MTIRQYLRGIIYEAKPVTPEWVDNLVYTAIGVTVLPAVLFLGSQGLRDGSFQPDTTNQDISTQEVNDRNNGSLDDILFSE